ncbi:hypothetical protein [Vagococcus salmoninarum]|uniref:hypothetical protein n=1 Tax=Vagococcus salmoninarum TaxID=2739 RepID=UPI003F9C66D0
MTDIVETELTPEDKLAAAEAELASYKSQVTELETSLISLADSKRAEVSPELLDLMPANYTPSQQLEWLDKASEVTGVVNAVETEEVEQITIGTSAVARHMLGEIEVEPEPLSVLEKLKADLGMS